MPSLSSLVPIPGGGSPQAGTSWFQQQGAPPATAAPAAPTAPGVIGQGLEQTPGFQFRLGEGLKALERSAAARGTLLTGGTLKGLERYAQDYASGEYEKRVNQLMGLGQLGLGAAGTQAQLGSQYGTNMANLITGQGNAQSAGTIGSGNAWQQGLGGISNLAQLYYLSRMMNPSAPGTITAPPLTAVNRPVPIPGITAPPLVT